MIVAVIPARGGSKRIPRKNIGDFFGQPILAYSIQAAQRSRLFDRILVSTDDEEIAAVARKWGAETPFLRPPALAAPTRRFRPAAEGRIDMRATLRAMMRTGAMVLKKRARRRLVGAIFFVSVVAVVLPMVMDHEPRQTVQDVEIRIPGQDEKPDRKSVV